MSIDCVGDNRMLRNYRARRQSNLYVQSFEGGYVRKPLFAPTKKYNEENLLLLSLRLNYNKHVVEII